MNRPVTTLPSGRVTFVMTDIEGSTRLMRRLGPSYLDVLDRHHELLRAAWMGHDGHEVNTEGDSFFVAFADPHDALRACRDAQRGLAAEPWPEGTSVSVRMGIHTGLAAPHGADYVALAVHQVARVVAAANGGQVLVTAEVLDQAHDRDPADVALQWLGRFRVRDFDDPIDLWHMGATDPPPPRVPPADRHNLVRARGELFGRDDLVGQLQGRIQPASCTTLVGPGGIGKTRLATELGLTAVDRWPDGAWFVDLSHLTDPVLVVRAAADALRVTLPADGEVLDGLVEAVARRAMLVIFDNAEHVRDAVARLVARLTAGCPDVAVLVTSRQRLGVAAEIVVHVPPLTATSGSPHGDPAVSLYCDRAAAVADGWRPSGDELRVVAELCRRLDGLPLAIEMAAARAGVVPAGDLLAALMEHSTRLATTDPTVPVRHRSLDDLLHWSDGLLTEQERLVFHAVGVFTDTFDISMAQAVTSAGVAANVVPDLIWSLTDKSLIVVQHAAGATRYALLTTVRDYVNGRADPTAHEAAVRGAARWLLGRVGPGLQLDQGWMGRMADDIDNIRGLIPVLARVDVDAGLRLAWSVATYLDMTHPHGEAITEVAHHADLMRVTSATRVGLLSRLADMHLRTGDVVRARRVLAEAEELRQVAGAAPWDAVGLDRTRGELALRGGQPLEAMRLADTALERDLGPRDRARMLNMLGIASVFTGDPHRALAAFHREVQAWSEAGEEALELSAYGNVAEVSERIGDLPAAAANQLRCLDLAVQYGQPTMIAYSAILAARLAGLDNDWEAAARLQLAADHELERLGDVLFDADRELCDELLAAARRNLGDERIDVVSSAPVDLDEMLAATTARLGRHAAG